MPARMPRMRNNGANGWLMLQVVVSSSVTSMFSTNCISARVLPTSSVRARSMLILTASPFTGVPSWKRTSGFCVKTIVSPSGSASSQLAASDRDASGTRSGL